MKKNDSIQELKVALIYGNRNVDEINKDGSMEEIYKYEEDVHHYIYMKHFLEKHLINERDVQSAAQDTNINNPDAVKIFFEIQKLGHIVFQETSTPPYKMGLIYIPKSISDKQRQTLKEFTEQLIEEDYTIVKLSNLFKEDGIIKGDPSNPRKS